MRDWLAEARAIPADPAPIPDAWGYVDKKDIEDETPLSVLTVHIVHPPLHLLEAEETVGATASFGNRFGKESGDVAEKFAVTSPFAVGDLGEWQRELSNLDPVEPPCPGFRHWPTALSEARCFLEERGAEAIDLGWGVLDLLGVHRDVGTIRVDCSGALLGLRGRPVIEMTTHLIRFADGLAYRRRPMLAGLTIPVWQFGARKAAA